MERTFGIEIECMSSNVNVDRRTVVAALLQNGIDAFVGNYTDSPNGRWMCKTDSSIELRGTQGVTMELVSPILRGEAGLRQVQTVGEVLVRLGMRVNTSTGMHVHFGASDLTVEVAKMIVRRYAKYQSDIDAVMPHSRRAGNCFYAKPISQIVDRIVNARAYSLNDLASVQMDRRYTVNLTPAAILKPLLSVSRYLHPSPAAPQAAVLAVGLMLLPPARRAVLPAEPPLPAETVPVPGTTARNCNRTPCSFI